MFTNFDVFFNKDKKDKKPAEDKKPADDEEDLDDDDKDKGKKTDLWSSWTFSNFIKFSLSIIFSHFLNIFVFIALMLWNFN